MEPQTVAPVQPPAESGQYNFIMDPGKPAGQNPLAKLGGNSFLSKIVVLVGGAVALMLVLAVGVNLIFGGRNNLDALVALAQSEQEIARLSDQSTNTSDQTLQNAAINTKLTALSHQQAWVNFLQSHRRSVSPEDLNLKKDASTDTKLKAAVQTSTFNSVYTNVMTSQLQAYATQIRQAYQGARNKNEQTLLNGHYRDVQLLLKQWPSTAGLALLANY